MNAPTIITPAEEREISVGSTRFASNSRTLVGSLFHPIGTANGTFKIRKNGVLFLKPDGAAFAFLVANPGQSRFFVSARRQDDGRLRYSYGLSENDAMRLGISGLRHIATCEEADRVWAQAKAIAEGRA